MRSSNYRNSNYRNARNERYSRTDSRVNTRSRRRPVKKAKKVSKLGSFAVTLFIVVAAVIIPGITLIQNVNAVTNVNHNVLSIGGSKVLAEAIADSDNKNNVNDASVASAKKSAEAALKAHAEATAPKALLSTDKIDSSYRPEHINLSSYDRAKLERLVMGEAGGLGYNGAALVAQTIRDTMELEKNNSIDYIINEYQYEGSTQGEASSTVKKAVAYIFDENGCAVQHRLLYFYASDMMYSSWHESQQYIISCGSEKFYDSWK